MRMDALPLPPHPPSLHSSLYQATSCSTRQASLPVPAVRQVEPPRAYRSAPIPSPHPRSRRPAHAHPLPGPASLARLTQKRGLGLQTLSNPPGNYQCKCTLKIDICNSFQLIGTFVQQFSIKQQPLLHEKLNINNKLRTWKHQMLTNISQNMKFVLLWCIYFTINFVHSG